MKNTLPTRGLLGSLLLVSLAFAGCSDPQAESPPSVDLPGPEVRGNATLSFDSAISTVRDLGLLEGEAALIYASATVYNVGVGGTAFPSGNATNWEMAFFDPLSYNVTMYRIDAYGIDWQGVIPNHHDWSLAFPAIDTAAVTSNIAALQSAVASLSGVAPVTSPGQSLNYWLTNTGGINTWQVSLITPGAPPAVVNVNAVTGGTISTAVPAPFGFGGAAAAVLDALPTSSIIEAMALESDYAGFKTYWMYWHEIYSIITPPDLEPGDGKAYSWVFVVRDFTAGLTLPVVVYGGGVVVVGDPMEGNWGNTQYETIDFDLPQDDADVAMAKAGITRDEFSTYNIYFLANGATNPVWAVDTDGWLDVIDAKTGVIRGGYP